MGPVRGVFPEVRAHGEAVCSHGACVSVGSSEEATSSPSVACPDLAMFVVCCVHVG